MRFAVTYQVEKIPIDYRMKIYALIKEAIRREDESYYKKVFINDRAEIKPLSFAVYLKDFHIENKHIILQEITITISSTMEFAVHAFNGFRSLLNYEVDGVLWKQTNIQLKKEAEITSGKVFFSTLSPILIENKQGKPLSPSDGDYEDELNYYANLQVMKAAGRKLYKPIRFTPVKMRKMVIQESNRFFKQTNENETLYFTTYRGKLQLEGHPDDLQILYQLGIGKRTSFFGLLEYEREEV